jgi:hypothetical protein
LWYVGYSYWRNINNHDGSNEMLIMLGMDRNAGGAGTEPDRLRQDDRSGSNRGRCSRRPDPYRIQHGEGWYFSGSSGRSCTCICRRRKTLAYDVSSKKAEAKPALI